MSQKKNLLKRVCFFGDYDPSYNRTKVLIEGLRQNGVEVVECREDPRAPVLEKCRCLWRAYRNTEAHDAVIVGFSNTRWMPFFARLLTRKPLLWDLIFSFYDNWVFDRKLVRPGSLKAGYHWFLDWLLPHFVNRVILHTNASIEYFTRTFHLPAEKFCLVQVGADTNVFIARMRTRHDLFRVEYHGKYIPLHGVETLIRAAKLLEEDASIRFYLVGDGQERKKMQGLASELGLTNVEFLGLLPEDKLVANIAEADVCIGFLGDVPRVEDAVGNKIYETAAMGRVCITAGTKAIREFFTDGKDIVLVQRGNAEDLASKIRYLKEHPDKRELLEKGVLETFKRSASPKEVGRQLIGAIEKVLEER